jgi:hypothetical protein
MILYNKKQFLRICYLYPFLLGYSAFSNITHLAHTNAKALFRDWVHVNATASIEEPAFIFDGTEFIVAKGKSAPKALRDLRGKTGIYAWFCITTGQIYVGSALDLFKRGYKNHYLNVESNKKLQEAIRLLTG